MSPKEETLCIIMYLLYTKTYTIPIEYSKHKQNSIIIRNQSSSNEKKRV